jgi:hypothetical protein
MNKLSLVGRQLPEKYKENFDVSSEGPSSGVIRRNCSYIFQVVASLGLKKIPVVPVPDGPYFFLPTLLFFQRD